MLGSVSVGLRKLTFMGYSESCGGKWQLNLNSELWEAQVRERGNDRQKDQVVQGLGGRAFVFWRGVWNFSSWGAPKGIKQGYMF